MKKLKFLYKLTIFFMITFTVIISCLYTYAYFSPKITLNSANALSLYDNENNLILQTSNNKKWANINEISNDLLNATISVEDKNFYHHFGFDYLRILKSLYLNAKTKSIVLAFLYITIILTIYNSISLLFNDLLYSNFL